MSDIKLSFTAGIWEYPGKAAWFFITMPLAEAKQVKFYHGHKKRGWGMVKVTATIGYTSWKTSIFPDTRTKSYLLPIKAEIRKKQNLKAGDMVNVTLEMAAML